MDYAKIKDLLEGILQEMKKSNELKEKSNDLKEQELVVKCHIFSDNDKIKAIKEELVGKEANIIKEDNPKIADTKVEEQLSSKVDEETIKKFQQFRAGRQDLSAKDFDKLGIPHSIILSLAYSIGRADNKDKAISAIFNFIRRSRNLWDEE